MRSLVNWFHSNLDIKKERAICAPNISKFKLDKLKKWVIYLLVENKKALLTWLKNSANEYNYEKKKKKKKDWRGNLTESEA